MKIYLRLRQHARAILLISAAAFLVQPVEGQSLSEGDPGAAQLEPELFLPFVSSTNSEAEINTRQLHSGDDEVLSSNHSDNNHSDNNHNRIHHHNAEHLNRSRFAALGDEWPPQPKSMRNVVWNDTSAVWDNIAQRRAKSQNALRDADVQDALGERFAYIGTEELARKGNMGRIDFRNTYFSHTHNQTVEVTVEQNRVTDVATLDAANYQPPLAPEEVEDAVLIARGYFAEQGVARITELNGFTILTYPREGEGRFYANRIGYVSFHPDSDTPPEYVAWVDLTNQVVVESREE